MVNLNFKVPKIKNAQALSKSFCSTRSFGSIKNSMDHEMILKGQKIEKLKPINQKASFNVFIIPSVAYGTE